MNDQPSEKKESHPPGKKEQGDEIIKQFQSKYETLQKEVSVLRKKGYDTKVCELYLMMIPPKVRIFQISRSQPDLENVRKYIQNVENEVVNLKKEVDGNDTNTENKT